VKELSSVLQFQSGQGEIDWLTIWLTVGAMVKRSDRHVRMERRTDARGRSFITKRHPCHITVLHKKMKRKKEEDARALQIALLIASGHHQRTDGVHQHCHAMLHAPFHFCFVICYVLLTRNAQKNHSGKR
jgi:hypothetical protein